MPSGLQLYDNSYVQAVTVLQNLQAMKQKTAHFRHLLINILTTDVLLLPKQ